MMSKQGMLPQKLTIHPVPVFTECLFGKATQRKWRHEVSDKEPPKIISTNMGKVVSVDQMILPTPGLVAQMTGWPTTHRYKCDTMYMDQAKVGGYLHMNKSTITEETE